MPMFERDPARAVSQTSALAAGLAFRPLTRGPAVASYETHMPYKIAGSYFKVCLIQPHQIYSGAPVKVSSYGRSGSIVREGRHGLNIASNRRESRRPGPNHSFSRRGMNPP